MRLARNVLVQRVQGENMNLLPVLGVLIFFASLLIFSVLLAKKTRRRTVSAFGAALLASLVIQLVSYLHLGYLQPFYQIAFVTSLIIGFPIALMVAYLVLRRTA